MTTIAIKVTSNLALAFEKADEEHKKKAELFINAWLNDFFSNQSANDRLFRIMEKASAEAKANGYDEDQLNDLLKSDE